MASLESGPDGNEERLVVRSDTRSDYVQFPGGTADVYRIEDYALIALSSLLQE